jgi:5-methylcytosine-specific restriction protein A
MLTEEQRQIHTEFRKYLRIEEGHKGNMLNTLINAAENNLPVLIKQHIRTDFECIYNDIYSIEELLSMSSKIKSNDDILAGPYGYISSKAIEAYIRFYAQKHSIDLDSITFSEDSENQATEDDNEEKQRLEGRMTEAKVLRRQRNRQARQQCLEASGYKCYVCGFDFEKTYGEIGKGFLEVHHTKPLATYDDEHPIPQSELCALCSNCHSMVHRKKEVLDVDELKRLYKAFNHNH